MKNSNIRQLPLESLESNLTGSEMVLLNREKFIEILVEINSLENLNSLKSKIAVLKSTIANGEDTLEDIDIDDKGDIISLRKDILISELNQIIESQTIERAKYYLKRLKNGIQKVKTSRINDINLLRWKEYDDIITDSLWIFNKRDTSGAHLAWYWGNFVPQIPYQMMLRYTKKGDWVLDAFVGSGTTLIECRRLGRNGIGIELNSEVVENAKKLLLKEQNENDVISEIFVGDSRTIDIKEILAGYGVKQVQLIIMHPPYHDVIRFSKSNKDLSNARSKEEFLKMFGEVVDNITPSLEKGRYLVLVIGDKYSKGEWIPLGFYCMQEVLKRGYLLKSIVVKNFEETRGKRNQKELWRYRALSGGFYVFKHEYIMLFIKK